MWFSWNADGSIARNWNSDNPSWRAAMTGTQLMPTIQNVVNGSFSKSVIEFDTVDVPHAFTPYAVYVPASPAATAGIVNVAEVSARSVAPRYH